MSSDKMPVQAAATGARTNLAVAKTPPPAPKPASDQSFPAANIKKIALLALLLLLFLFCKKKRRKKG